MRILEQCTSAWPMPDLQKQIDALRMAFSADINRPFELKPSFPYSSPSEGYESSPPLDVQYQSQLPPDHSFESQQQIQFQSITPPVSTGHRDSNKNSPQMQQTMGLMPTSLPQGSGAMSQQQMPEWDPSRLMSQWDSAFILPQSTMSPAGSGNSPPINMNMATSQSSAAVTMPEQPQIPPQSHPQMYSTQYPQTTGMTPMAPPQQSMSQQQQQYMAQAPVFVSSRDWQRSVASIYDPSGLKRTYSKMAPNG